jgi:hypothetical protein
MENGREDGGPIDNEGGTAARDITIAGIKSKI